MRFAPPIPRSFRRFATRAVDSLRLNTLREKHRRGRPVICKTRNVTGGWVASTTNLYFRLAGIPIRYSTEISRWQQREVDCFNMLNNPAFHAAPIRRRTVRADKLPGRRLYDYLVEGTLTTAMLEAAGREIGRAHRFWSEEFEDWWSHGDMSLTNLIYDEPTGRVRLIDFELSHVPMLPAKLRQADDLRVVLQDMVGFVAERQWLPFALAFLRSYGNAEVVDALITQLFIPGGLARIWWRVRTNFGDSRVVNDRLSALRYALARERTLIARDDFASA
jgi:tRNA A-37 threonylcarbamoyl transferase component Bud32